MKCEYDGEKGDMLCHIDGLEAKLNAAMDEVDRLNEDNEQLKAEIEWLKADNERLRGHLDKHKSGVATSAYALGREDARLQDAVNGAEKASKRIDGWPEWKKLLAYRQHDTDGDKESE